MMNGVMFTESSKYHRKRVGWYLIWVLIFLTIAIVILSYRRGLIDVGLSHIEANVPAEKEFRRFLIRDLESYFAATLGKPVGVDYELLRDAPTQSGISYPKYYSWVMISDGNKLISEGAVRVAAIDGLRFEVTDYLSKNDIRRDTQAVEKVFPEAL